MLQEFRPTSESLCQMEHDTGNMILSVLLTVGIALSYIPQHIKIIVGRSSEGISPWFLLLGGIACTSIFFNVVLLQFPIIKCCTQWPAITCFENTLGIIQVGVQWAMFILIIGLFIAYFPVERKYIHPSSVYSPLLQPFNPDTNGNEELGVLPRTRLWKVSIMMVISVLGYIVAVTIVSLSLLWYTARNSNNTSKELTKSTAALAFAGFLGGIATLMSCFQYVPQIIKTYRTKRVGALSILMMLMQVPGTLLLIYSLSLRAGINVSTYLSYIVAASLQAFLLILGIMYTYYYHNSGSGSYQDIDVNMNDDAIDDLLVESTHSMLHDSRDESDDLLPPKYPNSSSCSQQSTRPILQLPGQLTQTPHGATTASNKYLTSQKPNTHVSFPGLQFDCRSRRTSRSRSRSRSPCLLRSSSPSKGGEYTSLKSPRIDIALEPTPPTVEPSADSTLRVDISEEAIVPACKEQETVKTADENFVPSDSVVVNSENKPSSFDNKAQYLDEKPIIDVQSPLFAPAETVTDIKDDILEPISTVTDHVVVPNTSKQLELELASMTALSESMNRDLAKLLLSSDVKSDKPTMDSMQSANVLSESTTNSASSINASTSSLDHSTPSQDFSLITTSRTASISTSGSNHKRKNRRKKGKKR